MNQTNDQHDGGGARAVLRLMGLAVAGLGVFVLWPLASYAWPVLMATDQPWDERRLALLFPGVLLLIVIYLFVVGLGAAVWPSRAFMLNLGVVAGLLLWSLLSDAMISLDAYIVEAHREAFVRSALLVSIGLAVAITFVVFRWLGKRAHLLEQRPFWQRRNIRSLCAGLGWICLLVLWIGGSAMAEWIVEDVRDAFGAITLLSGIVLAYVIYKLGPPILMALWPPAEDRAPTPPEPAAAPEARPGDR